MLRGSFLGTLFGTKHYEAIDIYQKTKCLERQRCNGTL